MDETQIQLVHALHDHETLRSRFLCHSESSIDLLSTALQALRKGKTDITIQRIECVIEDIQKELVKLRAMK